jgi:netrin-G3 ligand
MKLGVLLVFRNMHVQVRCHQYWPDEGIGIKFYGLMKLHILETLVLPEYTIRKFSVTKAGCKDKKIVIQYHYTIWPDFGEPEYPTSFLHFVRKVIVSNRNPPNSGPTVVHCSAGAGSTGVFITLFSQLRRIVSERNLNVLDFVHSMRRNRCHMIRTEVSVRKFNLL